MPKGSAELIEKRRKEILDACEKIYVAKGYYSVNIKEISKETSLSRSAIYNYFETKEEILLGLLSREYELWCQKLEDLIETLLEYDRKKLAEKMAETLKDKETMLRILNMNIFEIEFNSRVECLAEFKKLYLRAIVAISKIFKTYNLDLKDSEVDEFCISFFAFLLGVYPFSFHTEKQIEAMKIAGINFRQQSLYRIIYNALVKLLP